MQHSSDPYEAYTQERKKIGVFRVGLAKDMATKINDSTMRPFTKQLNEQEISVFEALAGEMDEILTKMRKGEYVVEYRKDPWADVDRMFKIHEELYAFLVRISSYRYIRLDPR